jgi:hypothetical protein
LGAPQKKDTVRVAVSIKCYDVPGLESASSALLVEDTRKIAMAAVHGLAEENLHVKALVCRPEVRFPSWTLPVVPAAAKSVEPASKVKTPSDAAAPAQAKAQIAVES